MSKFLASLLTTSCIFMSGCAGSVAANMMEAQKVKKAEEQLKLERKSEIAEEEVILKSECENSFSDKFKTTKIRSLYQSVATAIPKKNEYETWNAFQDRAQISMARFQQPQFIPIQLNKTYVKYNAETQLLTFDEKAFGKTYLGDTFSVSVNQRFNQFTGSDHYSIEERVRGKPIGFIAETQTTDTHSFVGSNAFGATTEATAYQEESYGIFQDLKVWSGSNSFLWSSVFSRKLDRSYGPVVSVPSPLDKAKKLKETAYAVVLVEPRSPYLLKNYDGRSATFSSPSSTFDTQKYIVGDIKCLAIVSEGETLHVQPTL